MSSLVRVKRQSSCSDILRPITVHTLMSLPLFCLPLSCQALCVEVHGACDCKVDWRDVTAKNLKKGREGEEGKARKAYLCSWNCVYDSVYTRKAQNQTEHKENQEL